jgi:hypothetical protein
MECPKCKGRKFTRMFRHPKYGRLKKLCSKCYGRGEVDWLSNIFGTDEHSWQIIGRSELYDKFYNYMFFSTNNLFIVQKYHKVEFIELTAEGYYNF